MCMAKDEDKISRQEKILAKSRPATAKYSKVQSKLNSETAAMALKKRDKHSGQGGRDACTFGGQLIHSSIRAQPSWRKGL